MTLEEQIAKLQKLLHRVLLRGGEPRVPSGSLLAGKNGTHPETGETAAPVEGELTLFPEPPAVYTPLSLDDPFGPTLPLSPGPEGEGRESRSRLVSAPLSLDDEALDELSSEDVNRSSSRFGRSRESAGGHLDTPPIPQFMDLGDRDLDDDTDPRGQGGANELEEPAPSSSRRPIVTDEPEHAEDSAPRHTPPPESGRQVAVLPLADNDFSEITEVRRSSVPVPSEASAPPPALVPLLSEVAHTSLMESHHHVATILSTPTTFAPASFGELLDATLDL